MGRPHVRTSTDHPGGETHGVELRIEPRLS